MIDKKTLNIMKQTYTQLIKILGISLLLFTNSCSKEEKQTENIEELPTVEEITHIYSLYTNGNMYDFVKHIASCQGKPQFYQEQIINLYKQQLANQESTYGKIDSIYIEQMTYNNNKTNAIVHIRHFYSNSPSEIVLIQMKKTEHGWMLK